VINQRPSRERATNRRSLSFLTIGASAAIALLIVNISVTFHNTRKLGDEAKEVEHTYQVLTSLENIISLTRERESGIRGYVITGQPVYLEAHAAALADIQEQANTAAQLTRDNPRQQAKVPVLRQRIAARINIMDQTIAVYRNQGADAAAQLVLGGEGKQTMDALQAVVTEMIQEEQKLLTERSQQHRQVYRNALVTGGVSGVAALAAILAFIIMLRQYFTSRAQSAAIIAEQTERLRTTLASIGDAVITTDTEGRVTNLNAVAESLTGYRNDEAAGQPLSDIFEIVNENSRQPVENPAIRTLIEGVIVGLANHTILIAKDGTERPIDDSAAPIYCREGEIVGCVLVFRDVTERRLYERQLREERENLALALGAADLGQWDLNLIDNVANRTLRHDQIFGHDTLLPEWTYEMFLEHVLPADRSRVDATFQAALKMGTTWEFECRIRRADGTERWIWGKGLVQRGAHGRSERMYGLVGDITDRKNIEAEIREARSRLESTLTASEIGTWRLDFSRNTIQADRNTAHIFSMTPEEAADGPLSAFMRAIHPDDQPLVTEALERTLETGDPFNPEYRLLRSDGSTRWVVARGRVEQDESGQTVMSGVVIDITTQRQAEAQVRESEARFRQIADTMPQMVWVTRADGYTEYFNRRWYEYTGLTPEESLGNSWSLPLHPNDQQTAIDTWEHAIQSGEPYEIEYRFRSHSGEYRWFLGRGLPVRDETGQITKWFGTCTDIEAFKRLEEERQKFVWLADNSTEFIGISDLAGAPLYLNRAGRNMLGLDGMEEVQHVNLIDCFFPEDQPRIANEFLPAVRTQGHGRIEVRLRHFKTEGVLWMLYSVSVLINAQGEQIGLAIVGQDITERRQSEQELRQLAADLSEGDRRKDEFLATLAHELRNPLAPIRNGLEIMKLNAYDDRTERVRAIMERQVVQMVRLVDDLLDMSRISRGRIDLRRERVELSSIIEQAIETSRPLIDAAQHELTVRQPPQPIYLNADSVRIAQVISNLLTNASKYSEPNGHIWLTAEQQGSEVVVSVRDTGIGLSSEMLPQIFDLFTQADGSAVRSQGGLGIGLTLVKRLVEMHGGSVSAYSEGPNQGSEFTVRLPLLIDSPTSLASQTEMSEPTPTKIRRILIVDDNEDAAWSLELLFEATGDETRRAADGLAALAEAEAFQPDIVLLDIGLPKLNGYEVARKIREQPWGKEMILVALTGWGQEEDRRRSSKAGFNAHMVKPIEHAALTQLLAELSA
jgi:PAS domain S-box-containing protein